MWLMMTRDIANISVIFRVVHPKHSARLLGLVYKFNVSVA